MVTVLNTRQKLLVQQSNEQVVLDKNSSKLLQTKFLEVQATNDTSILHRQAYLHYLAL